MAHFPHAQRELQEGALQFPLKVPCKKLEPLKNAACIRFAPQVSLNDTDDAKLVAGRGDGLFACAARHLHQKQASRPLEVCARMACLLTTRC